MLSNAAQRERRGMHTSPKPLSYSGVGLALLAAVSLGCAAIAFAAGAVLTTRSVKSESAARLDAIEGLRASMDAERTELKVRIEMLQRELDRYKCVDVVLEERRRASIEFERAVLDQLRREKEREEKKN